jgi:tetratricopeptide (TPR) repeat protein
MGRLLVACVALLCFTQVVHAATKDPPAYTEAVDLGVSEFDAQNYVEARAHFARAHALYSNARTLRALGMVAFELKRYIECIEYLSDALASNERRLEGEKRRATEKLLERANGYVARYTLDIEPGTQLILNGAPSGLAPGSVLVLEVGDHVLDFQATGHLATRRNLTIQGGEHETLQVRLASLAAADAEVTKQAPTPATPPTDKPTRRPVYKNPWLWTALGLVVAGAAAGTAVALTSGDTTTKSEAPYPGTGGAPPLGTPR